MDYGLLKKEVNNMANTYRIGSFNMYKYSANTYKNKEAISNIIKNNNIDILAIQEIFSEQALKNLLGYLNEEHWAGSWASPNSKSASAAEGYAYIWNKDRISLSRNKSGKVFYPVIHNQYSYKDVNGISEKLIRNPFYGRFTLKSNEQIEIRLINTHIMFSKTRSINDSDDHDTSDDLPNDVNMRKREFSILASGILPKIDNKDYDLRWNEQDTRLIRPYTILLGDYNLNLKDSGAGYPYIEPLISWKDSITEKSIITIQNDKSTLKARRADNPHIAGLKNNYDHFTYDENRPIQVNRCWAADPMTDSSIPFDYDKYKDEISDHLMVIMEISFK